MPQTTDPRLIKAGYKRKKYIYDSEKAMQLFAEWVEKQGIKSAAGGMAFPEDLDSAQLAEFWSSEILGEGTGTSEDGGRGGDSPDTGDEDQGGGDTDNSQPEQPQETPQQEKPPALPPMGKAPQAQQEAQEGRTKDKNPDARDIIKELTGGALSQSPDLEERQQQQGQGEGQSGDGSDDSHKPSWWRRLLAYSKIRNNKGGHEPVLLIGPTGCGKTHVVEELARHMEREFYVVSCNEETAAEVIIGYPIANVHTGSETFVEGPLLRAIKHGGVFLADEFDAMHPNAALVLQTALSNGWVSVPGLNNGQPIKVHPEFFCIATANTFGHGADRNYMGRNVQDKAVMDRFRPCQINIDYDSELEKKIGDPKAVDFGHRIRQRCRFTDDGRPRKGFNRDISTRNIMAWSYQLKAGIPLETAVYGFFEDWTEQELAKVDLRRYDSRTAIVDQA